MHAPEAREVSAAADFFRLSSSVVAAPPRPPAPAAPLPDDQLPPDLLPDEFPEEPDPGP